MVHGAARRSSKTYFRDADVLGERAAAAAEDLVPRPERGDVLAHASTCPAMSAPRPLALGRDSPAAARTTYGVPLMKCQSSGLTDAAMIGAT